jgi:peptide/nickel transport system substrate-binding protein
MDSGKRTGAQFGLTEVVRTNGRRVMLFRSMRHFAAAALISAGLTVPAFAETPADTLVIADQIEDIVSLDPAESFEFSGQDALLNVYDRLIRILPANNFALEPGLADSWSVADDGKTYAIKMKEGIKFHSGNPVTAEDAAWSLQRVVKLAKTPSFILTQFGLTPENVDQMIKVTGPMEFTITTDKAYAQSFFYNCLTAIVASVVDKKLAMEHEANGDMGYEWLKTNSAGSGPYMLRSWKAADSIVLDRVDGYWGGDVALKRVFVRHVPESATRRLQVEQGDADIARRLPPNDAEAIAANADLQLSDQPRGLVYYLGANQKYEPLAKPKVVEALRYLIDYEGMANTFLKGQYVVHQSFLPAGFLGAIDDKPYKLDVEKAKALLAEAGYPDGFDVEISVRNSQPATDIAAAIQNTLAQGGIRAAIKSGAGAEILDSYRARTHQLIVQNWGPDYPDPHTNAGTFADNPGNADEDKNTGYLAWRNAYPADQTKEMVNAAVVENDTEKRGQMYEEIQRIDQKVSPIIIMFQENEQVGMGKTVNGFSSGGAVSSAFYWTVTKQ